MTRPLTALLAVITLAALVAGAAPKGRRARTADVFHGIDVSHHQGAIDWATVKGDSRVGFVYVRASNGSHRDKNYRRNFDGARAQRLLVGSYHFLNPNCAVRAQFDNFLACARPGEQDLIPVVDIEDVPELGVTWKPQQARDFMAEFADLVERHYGCKPMIYTSNKFFTDYLGRAFADFPLFIARYGPTEPNPLNGAHWTLWQFTRQGRVEGINHDVDLSRFNRGYGIGNIRMAHHSAKKGKTRSKAKAGKDKADTEKAGKGKGKNNTAAKPKASAKSGKDTAKATGKKSKAASNAGKAKTTPKATGGKRGKTKGSKQGATAQKSDSRSKGTDTKKAAQPQSGKKSTTTAGSKNSATTAGDKKSTATASSKKSTAAASSKKPTKPAGGKKTKKQK